MPYLKTYTTSQFILKLAAGENHPLLQSFYLHCDGLAKWLACLPLTRQVVGSRPGQVIPKTIIKWYKPPPCMARNVLGLEFGSAARLSKRPCSVWNCLWGHALERPLGINRKSRVLYPGPGFLSSATRPSLPKKYYNGLINQLINHFACCC